MKAALVLDFILLTVVAFLDWLFPGVRDTARETVEDAWVKFVDLEPRRIGCFAAGFLTHRLDATVGSRLLGRRYLVTSFLLSQVVFLAALAWVSLAWGVVFAPTIHEAT